MEGENSFQRYAWLKSEFLELETCVQTLKPESDSYLRANRVLFALKQELDSLRNSIAEKNAHIVDKLVKKYNHPNMESADFYQEAHEALLNAVDSYEPSFGVPFEAFAYMWIRKRLSHMVETEWGPVRIPDSVVNQCRKNKESTSICKYEMYEDVYTDKAPSPEEVLIRKSTRKYLQDCVRSMSSTIQKILHCRYLREHKCKSLEKVAKQCGMSREKTRLLEKDALKDIKSKLNKSKAFTSCRQTNR